MSPSDTLTPGPTGPSGFVQTLFDLLDRVEYRRVSLNEKHSAVMQLRYEAYRREEFVPVNSQRITTDDLDDLPNAMGFGVYIDNQLASSIRLHHVTSEHRRSPSTTVYPDILDPLLDKGMRFIDPSRFTADQDASLAYPALPFLTLRIAAMASVHFAADLCLATVRPEHGAFYRRVFGSKKMGGERAYPGLTFPVILLGADVETIKDRVGRRYPFFYSSGEERQLLFAEPGPGNPWPAVSPTARIAHAVEKAKART